MYRAIEMFDLLTLRSFPVELWAISRHPRQSHSINVLDRQ
jgi:hypothetical protein